MGVLRYRQQPKHEAYEPYRDEKKGKTVHRPLRRSICGQPTQRPNRLLIRQLCNDEAGIRIRAAVFAPALQGEAAKQLV